MDSIAISHFKARCLAVLAEVNRSGRPILVTRRGKPVAEIVPPSRPSPSRSWLGSAAGSGRITGDIVEPAVDPADWEAMAD
ncbi:MAG: type II toxin-antitoxin system Phd/YefM family antitoxin [Acidimicrobiia bacterium]